MTRNALAAVAVALLAVLGCQEEPPPPPVPLTVLATASMEELATEAAAEFGETANVTIEVRSAGTHQLAEELISGASADLFLAVGTDWMDRLEEQGLIVPGSRWERVGNRLIVLGREEAGYPAARAVEVGRLGFRRFVVPDPDRDPVGGYARRWLQGVGARGESVWGQIQGRLEAVDDVDQVLREIAGDPSAVGVAFVSDLGRIPTGKVLFRSPELGIRYSIALVERPGRPPEARQFLDFLQGPAGAELLQVNGFVTEP